MSNRVLHRRTRSRQRAKSSRLGSALAFLFETEEHKALRTQIQKFVRNEIEAHIHEWEERGEFPRSLYRTFAQAGGLAVGYPESLGGVGGDLGHMLVAADEFVATTGSGGLTAGLGSHAIALPPIVRHGTAEQKESLVRPVLSGEKIAALAVTEPTGGSDVASIETRAQRDGEFYVVNGRKTFITSGFRADFVTAAVRTGEPGAGGISVLVMERSAPGYVVSKPLKKMGWWASDTAELVFEDCRVPVRNMIGPENAGFPILMENFVAERVLLAGQCVGIARRALLEARAYSQNRTAFGRPLAGFQVTRHKLAEMQTRLAAASALVGEVVIRALRGESVVSLAAMSKNTATDACSWICDEAVQIHGGYGYMREQVVERLYRDARLYPIGGGTREIMNELISKVQDA